MNNEELALTIQRGETGRCEELWASVGRLLCMLAGRYYNQYKEACTAAGVAEEDCKQEAYFAMLDAVAAYNPDKGFSFNSYINHPLRNRLNALSGQRSRRGAALNHAMSLDMPLGNEDATLADTLADPQGEATFDALAQRDYNRALRADLDAAMETLEPQQQETIRGRFYDGRTLAQVSGRIGRSVNATRQIEAQALCRLRSPACMKMLGKYRDDIASAYGLRGTGLGTWRNTGTSSTESAAMKLWELDEIASREDVLWKGAPLQNHKGKGRH